MRHHFIALFMFVLPMTVGADDSPVKSTPAEDIQSIQGQWEVSQIYWPSKGDPLLPILPPEIRLNNEGVILTIKDNRITEGDKVLAILANDLMLPGEEKEIGYPTHRLLMLTTPEGKGLLCSYLFWKDKTGENLKIAYTHKCSCNRGTGQVINLKRIIKMK